MAMCQKKLHDPDINQQENGSRKQRVARGIRALEEIALNQEGWKKSWGQVWCDKHLFLPEPL